MDTNVIIINEVKKHDCLYNKQSESYKDFVYKNSLWSKIGSGLGLPAEKVKKKFRNLRDAYTKYKKFVEKPESDILRKPYKYAQHLTFLDELNTAEFDLEDTFFKKRRLESEYFEESSQDPFELIDNTANSTKDFQISERSIKCKRFTREHSPQNSEIVSTTKRKTKQKTKNCTMQLFQCLANKLTEANLTEEQKNIIECSVCRLVYSKIIEYTKDSASSL
ncbi:uncharacterized protein LOC119613232 isoform X2 [Lucilia sericata]|uniref:uncharacterized protein LOC119613232 isoform X2 n=1 Tax=Lucilia sericata TaxID=13632 RepID=UPI0018A82DDB|nr:uncharacterized protein LOC119613232 isoform X2 [Lucilia sericata]